MLQTTSIRELYQKVCERVNVELGNTILFFGNQILPSDSDETLEDYDIVANSNITLVQRVVGGGAQIGSRIIHPSVKLSRNKCVILQVDDDTISKRVEMPCGHAITPDGLAAYVDSEVKSRKTKITCPVQRCQAEWKISEIIKRGLTPKERESFETGVTKNTLRAQGFQECLRCSAYIQRQGNGTRMSCPICKQRGTQYEFCWTCQKQWRNHNSYNICGNVPCDPNAELQKILNTCSTKGLYGVQVPEVRACPHCKKAINHKEACKHMTCPSCGTEFCYICLSIKSKSWSCGSYNSPCTAAPRQVLTNL